MAPVDVARTNGHDLSDAEARVAAREMWLRADAAGEPLTGVDLGRVFGKTDRWGRKQIETARDSADSPVPSVPASSPSGSDDPAMYTFRNDNWTGGVPAGTGVVPGLDSGTAPATATTDAEQAPTVGSRRASWPDRAAMLVVALVAAGASYGHMLEVAIFAGQPLWIARAYPIIVDGLVFIALRRGREGRYWLLLGLVVSVAANVLAEYPDLAADAGPFVSAWPPLALFGTHRLIHGRAPRDGGER